MSGFFATVLARELRLAARRPVEALLPVVFFVVAASLFPLGVGPEPQTLRHIAPGVLWVGALLAAMLSLAPMYGSDHADGSLEQLLLAPEPAWLLALAKAVAHWLTHGLPLVAVSPLIGLMFGLPGDAIALLLATGQSVNGHLSLLAALFIAALVGSPPATAAALRIALA